MDRSRDRCGGDDGARPLADAALELAGLGLAVFPLVPGGKLPLIGKDHGGRGCHDGTSDLDQVRAWWARWPGANVGIATGASCWALDLDGEEGLATLADLEDRHRWLPVGPASVTGGGGMHFYFKPDPRVRNTVAKLGPGLDTRGAGGSAVAPPSIHPNGNRYCWLLGREAGTLPLPAAPAWLLDLLDPPRPAEPAVRVPQPPPRARTAYVEAAIRDELVRVATAGVGERNVSLFRASRSLGRFVDDGSLDARDIGPALVGAAVGAGLDRMEAQRTTASGLRTALREGS